ncbi:polysaccharide deacetylase [Leptodontidium sp. 2 PMI_412]|nr:polysaccharide deacetylase [Leptodontidium sp. 2 PMI_412]
MAPTVPRLLPVLWALSAVFGLFPLTSASPQPLTKRAAPPFGQVINSCTVPGVLAPAFDDGPWIYTDAILDKMAAANFKATWFINGHNKDDIYKYNATIRKMVSLGHQIGSHTWSHQDLTTLSVADQRLQMTQLEEALVNILGYFPYYMRPPFLAYNAQVLDTMRDLEYVVIIGDLNTKDWQYQSADLIVNAEQLFLNGLAAGGSIAEAHDPDYYTATDLIDFMIGTVQNRSIITVPIGQCMGQPQADWYRTTRTARSSTTVWILSPLHI